MPIFEYNGKKYNVKDEHIDSFMNDFPDASTIMEREGKKYRVKSADYKSFMTEHPEQQEAEQQPATAAVEPVQTTKLSPTDVKSTAVQSAPKGVSAESAKVDSSKVVTAAPTSMVTASVAEGANGAAAADTTAVAADVSAPWNPTEDERAAMLDDLHKEVRKGERKIAAINEQVSNIGKYNSGIGKITKRPVEIEPEFNDETGELEKRYLTPAGNVYSDKASADKESFYQREADDYLRGKIWSKKPKHTPSIWESMWKSIASGIVGAGEGFVDMMNALTSGYMVEAPAGSDEAYIKMPSYAERLNDENDPMIKLSTSLGATAERLREEADPAVGKGFVDLISEGKIGKALHKGVATAGESALMTMSARNPYTMLLMFMSNAGRNYKNNTVENPDIPSYKRAAQAIGSAAFEQVVEKYADPVFKHFGGGKVTEEIAEEASKKLVKKSTKEATDEIAKRIYGRLKGVARDARDEGIEEIITGVGNDMLGSALDAIDGNNDYGFTAQWNRLKEDNPEADLWDFAKSKGKEYADAFIGGALSGAYMSGSAQLTAGAAEYAANKLGGKSGSKGSESGEPQQDVSSKDGQNEGENVGVDNEISEGGGAEGITSTEVAQPLESRSLEIMEAYNEGYAGYDNPQEYNDAKIRLGLRYEMLHSALGLPSEVELDDYLEQEHITVESLRSEGKDAVAEMLFDYQKADAAFNGILNGINNGINSRIAESDAMIDARTHTTTGMVQSAVMKVGDRRVYVVGGELVQYDDGSGINSSASSGTIMVRDAETGEIEQVSPSDILNVDAPLNPIEEKRIAAEAIIAEQRGIAQAKINGTISFNEGDSYRMMIAGEPREVTLVANEQGVVDNGDGSVNVTDGNGVFTIYKSALQGAVDEANRARVAEFEQQRAVRNGDVGAQGVEASRDTDVEPQDVEPQSDVASRPQYRLNDVVTLNDGEGNVINGEIADYDAAEDVFFVDVDRPINGRYVVPLTRADIESMIVMHNGVEVEPIEVQEDAAAEAEEGEAFVSDLGSVGDVKEHGTALGRVPKDAAGNPIYEQTDSDTAWDAIVEQTEGDEAMAQAVADSMVADKEAALKKLEKAKSKGGATIADKIAAEKERKAAIDAAQQEVNIWKKIAGTANRRKMDAEAERRRIADEAAALRKAEEEKLRAEREEAERIEREALNGVPDMVDDTPQDARARGYRRVSGHKIDRQEPVQGLQGKEVAVRFSDDAIANGRVAVIDATQLQPSHIQGVRNPLHFIDEAQPKERNDEASVMSARKIAGNIRPEEITSSVTAYTGAPTVNARGEAIQGNNRSDALRLMWESHEDQAAQYKQYLIDHADEFGLNADDVAAMERPVLVNMLDVDDAEAITLGQFVAQDTESGGTERIKPKNALQKMGNDMRSFANLLLKSNDEDTSFAGLVDNNGVEVLKWMSQRGYITPTQYKSAFDSKGNLTAEAKNDLRGIMYQSIFKGGSTRLEEMFNAMPARAQKAILATAFRDYDSPNADRMIEEIQNSIRAFYALSQSEDFVNAKTFKDARLAVEGWKIQYQIDDVTGESYLPAENFSNFALLLATMYKGDNQSVIQGTFNKLYDLIQGTQEPNLFEQPDNTPRTLAQAIYETLNITYDGQQRSNVLVGDSSASQRGQQGSTGDAATGERVENGERTADSAGSIEAESTTGGETVHQPQPERKGLEQTSDVGRKGDSTGVADDATQEVLGASNRGDIRVFEEGLDTSYREYSEYSERTRRTTESERLVSLAKQHGLFIPAEVTKTLTDKVGKRTGESVVYIDKAAGKVTKVKDPYAKSAMKSGVQPEDAAFEHLVHNLLFPETAYTLEGISEVMGDVRIVLSQDFIQNYEQPTKEQIAEALAARGLFPEDNYSFGNELVSVTDVEGDNVLLGEDGTVYFIDPIILFKKPLREILAALGGAEQKAPTIGEQIQAAEAEVNTNPTEAQKEAGNYKKGHVQIGTFNVTIEQPKGSVRSGVDKGGKKWEVEMKNTYGYIRGTEGVDGDHIDVFLSDDIDGWDGHKVFVVDQRNADGSFDEHKVMLGFNDINDAEAAYMSNYEEGWQGLGAITGVSIEEFEKWIASSHRKTKAFAEYKSIKTAEGQSASAERRNLADFKEGDVVRDYYDKKLYRIKKHSKNGVSTIAMLDEEGNEVGTTQMNAHNNSRYSIAEAPVKAETPTISQESEQVSDQDNTPYTIAPAQYTTKKGKVLDMHLVKFAGTLTKEQQRAAKELAKADKGWYDREQGGFMMRSEESAKQLADTILNNDDAVSDAQPVSMTDIQALNNGDVLFTEPQQVEQTDSEEKSPVWQYSIHVDKETGRTTLRRDDVSGVYPIGDARWQHTAASPEEMLDILRNPLNGMQDVLEAVGVTLENKIKTRELDRKKKDEAAQSASKPSGNRLVTDERYAELRERMRKKLGGQMNIGIDPEILAIGTEMAVYHLEKGARKFTEYAKAMIADLGDAIRPYLKAFYNGARNLPEVEESNIAADMTPYDEVQGFDVANFDKQTVNAFATAETVTREAEVEKEVEVAQDRIKKSREFGFNGYKIGDKVMYTPQGKREATEATIYDFEAYGEHKPVLDTGLAPVLYEVVEWSDIKPVEKKKSQKKSVTSQPQTGDLFGGLFEEAEQAPKAERKEDAAKHRAFAMKVKEDMLAALDSETKPYRSIIDLRKRASELGMEVDNEGRTDILLQELVEDGLVRAAREVIEKNGRDNRTSYDLICKLYDMQPTIAARSSNRIKMQQYSTPLPMAWAADFFAMANNPQAKVLEPTAGNGMLVFAIPAEQVHANELDETRLDNLREQGFAQVTQQDATEAFEGGEQYDAVIANPPFGKREAVEYDGKMIPGLDPQITLNALSSMRDNGKAAIIIGGNMEYAANGGLKSMKPFFTYLYDHYNVKGVIDMEGKLYAKQGTTYPTRMILIDGRRSEEERAQSAVYPPTEDKALRRAESFEDLFEIVNEVVNSKEKTNGTEILRSRERKSTPINNKPSGRTDGKRHSEQPRTNDTGERGKRTELERTPKQGENVLRGEHREDIGNGEAQNTVGGSERGNSKRSNEPVNAGVGTERVSTNGVGLKTEQKKRSLTEEKLSYRPHNGAFSLNSVAPAAMVEAMDNVLSQIEAEHGNIDEFIKNELGYDTIEEAHQALAAEQMDSVAMAIYQMKKGQALIIGDQTGVGKGRQMAALIRWAVMRGEKPVFITQKADLFSDIYRDLVDIGSGDLVPFIFNSDGAMVDSKGNTVHKPLSSSEMAKVFATGALPDKYDFAVLTYSQVNTGDAISQQELDEAAKERGTRTKKSKASKTGKATPKATFLRSIAEDNYLFLDESHTAAGTSNTGAYLQSILRTAKAATFASATFAKRPDTMPLYAIRTAMSQAKVEPDKMIGIIEKGGVTLQEIMSRELTNAGQMVRRERDMSDVKTDWKTIDDPETVRRARENYDRTIAAFNAIIKFQEDYVKPKIAELDMELAITAESAGVKRGTDKMGVENVPFASKTYNYTKQLMLALKVDAIANEVEAEINAGRHPVIALESTMESSIKEYAAGEVIEEPTFSASLLKGLDTVMQYTVKDEDGNETHARYTPQQLGKAGEQAFYELQDFIRESTSDIFISPLDAIIERLHEKGFKVGELTGRNMYVERTDNGEVVVRRRTDKDKKRMQREFNDGTLDVLILNKSASTGISLHASEKFSDQRQRSMIIAQPLSDINDYMQMIGRIDRTGQVHRGYYINLGLPVPAENRFLMMLSTKLKSLNANTTTSQDSESNEVEAPDLLNKYGSQVVVEYLRDNPDVYEKMGTPLKKGGLGGGRLQASELDEYKPQEDDARKVTGYVALLSTKEQEEFYDDVVRRYNELIKYLNDTGSNDLKITVMPLRATTLEKRVSSEGIDPNGSNPFARNSYVEKVEMDVLRKPMKADEVRKTIEQINKGYPTYHLQGIIETIQKEEEARISAEEARHEKAMAKAIEDIAKQREKINRQQKRTEEEKQTAIANYKEETENKVAEKHRDNLLRINNNSEQLQRRLRMFEVGKSYLVPETLDSMMFDFASPAIFCGYKTKDSKITASTTLAVFATLDGRRRVEVKLSDIGALQSIEKMTNDNWDAARSTTLDTWDSQIPQETRKQGYIMTGNILQAIADTQDEHGGYPGQLISYTDIDGNVHDGILMPDKWNASMLKSSGAPLSSRMQQIKEYQPITSHDGKVSIMGSSWAQVYYLTVPKTKKDGAIYFENKTLLNAAGGNFYPHRGMLRADIPAHRIEEVVKTLTQLGVKVKEEPKQDEVLYRENEIKDRIKDRIEYLFNEAISGGLRGKSISIGKLTDAGRKYLQELSGIDMKEHVDFVLNPSDMVHIYKDHYGSNEKDKGQNIPLDIEDVRSIVDVISNPDKVVFFKEGEGSNRNMFYFFKRAENGTYNLMEIYSDRKGNLTAKTFYKTRKDASQRIMDLEKSLFPTSETNFGAILSDAKIPQMFETTSVEGENFERKGYGPLSDDELSYENDPMAIVLGRSTRSRKQRQAFAARERAHMAEHVQQMASKLNLTNVEVVTSVEGLDGKKRSAKGWYSKSSGKIVIVIPNHASVVDVEQTLLHEAVAHHGLRELFGEHFDRMLDNVFNNVEEPIRRKIAELAAKNGWDIRTATEEYMASLAEDTDFEDTLSGGWMQQVLATVRHFFMRMLTAVGFKLNGELTDNELRYILWRSYMNLKELKHSSVFAEAADVAKQYELKVGEYANTNSTDNDLYRDGDPEIHERELARDRYEQRVKSGMFQSREALQDSMLGLKEAMSAILGHGKNIEDVDGYENAYLGENRLSSVNKAEADAFAHTLFKPMLDEVAKLAPNNAGREELTDYMMAKHGLERNAKMAEREFAEYKKQHPNGQKTLDDFRARDYAGLTALTGYDDVAQAELVAEQMVADYEASHDTTALWEKVNAVSKAILSKSYECGMMSKETFDSVSDMYEYYIPLRGFDETTSADAYAYLSHKSSAFNAPIKKAQGRTSKADDPFANLQSMAESAIMQGNRNKLVKQRFLNFALNHPSDLVSVSDLWVAYDAVTDEWKPVFPDNIDSTDTPEEVERKMQDFETKMEALAQQDPDLYKRGKDAIGIPYRVVESRDLRQHQVIVKRGGRDYVIAINGNPRAAQALNGQTNPDNDTSGAIGAILRAGEKINRQLSAFYTTRNPDFIVSNFMRDMLYTNSMVWIKESPNYALRFHRTYATVNPVIMKRLLAKYRKGELDMSNKTEAMFQQFMMNGGETGYANIRDIEQHKNDIRKELKKANGRIPVRKAWDLLAEQFDELNRAVENCARFAAFITSREMGRSIDRAVYDAKEISVNFNKKGSGAKFYDSTGQTKAGNASALISGLGRSGYVFWNAAIQGTTNFGRQLKRHPAKAYTGIAVMFLLGAVVAYLGGDDDEDDKNAYYNLPEYVRRSNILFKAGDSWISIPLPIEYRAFYGMGELMTSVFSGKEHLTGGEIAEAIAGQATQVLPIDFLEGGGGLNAFVPSAAKPLWEAYVAEKSWTGMPIYKDTPFNKDMPEWTKAYKSANKHIVNLAATINEATGGDAYTKGVIDFNPAKVEYLLNGYFGGVFGTIDKMTKSVETIVGAREYDPRSILLVNRLVKAGDERTEYRAVNNEYFRLKEEHDRIKSRLRHYEEDTDAGVFDYAEKIDFLYNSPEYERYEIFEYYRKDIDDLYNELKEAVDDEERKSIEAELNEVKKEMIEEMNLTRNRK